MRLSILFLLILTGSLISAQSVTTVFEQSKGAETPTYQQIVQCWQQLDQQSPVVKMQAMGMTDAGYPLHLILVSSDGNPDIAAAKKKNKRIILVNNGIHPGEPDGIDASMLLVRDIVAKKYSLPDNVLLAIIPVYNIGGCLNRSSDYRVDQNGPDAFGSRGNSQNYDLNRDFIKCDSRESRSFAQIFHLLDPDVFVDNHVSNGADYQHVMTLLTSQHNKMGGAIGEYLNSQFEPALYRLMKEKGFDLVPYVNHWSDKKVEDGWQGFWDGPRYSSGYGSLWNTFSFVPETHMLKPYTQRVAATYALMQSFIAFTSINSAAIKKQRDDAKEAVQKTTRFPIGWEWDAKKSSSIVFKGYESGYKPSEISGLPRLYYDRSKPFTKDIPYYNFYNPVKFVDKPVAYIIPQGWSKVIELLRINGIHMQPLKKDTSIQVEVYRIEEYKPAPMAYEGHHINRQVSISNSQQVIRFRKGDWYIPMNQVANRFLVETLDPRAEDSYFAWNFFDGILQQKEGYSAYAFEDIAATYLKGNKQLQTELEEKRKADTAFAKSASRQLDYVYQHSPYYEPDHLRYPVYRVL